MSQTNRSIVASARSLAGAGSVTPQHSASRLRIADRRPGRLCSSFRPCRQPPRRSKRRNSITSSRLSTAGCPAWPPRRQLVSLGCRMVTCPASSQRVARLNAVDGYLPGLLSHAWVRRRSRRLGVQPYRRPSRVGRSRWLGGRAPALTHRRGSSPGAGHEAVHRAPATRPAPYPCCRPIRRSARRATWSSAACSSARRGLSASRGAIRICAPSSTRIRQNGSGTRWRSQRPLRRSAGWIATAHGWIGIPDSRATISTPGLATR